MEDLDFFYFYHRDQKLTPDESHFFNKYKWQELYPHMAENRRMEFALGRMCAHFAIKKLKIENEQLIEINTNRSPKWIDGIVGSISHSKRMICAICKNSKIIRSIGVDIEEIGRAKEKIAKYILNSHDVLIPELAQEENLTLIFSIKEAFYKLLNPLNSIYFGFQDASVVFIDFKKQKFKIKLNIDLDSEFNTTNKNIFDGKFFIFNNHYVSYLEIPW